ncbi:MAG: anhydro-N-acetylmuramic acid kinase [candidate division NC10 bacterium]|nr:anhydro-N-acetylmuramic acid kinase [candidate division NC10 bacterium]
MSGTSADGIDAALVRITPGAPLPRPSLLHFRHLPFPADLRTEILACTSPPQGTVDRVCRLHARLGEAFAEAALGCLREAGAVPEDVALIGSHGQTLHHQPEGGGPDAPSATLQVGSPAHIAERTGITTVADFRPRDLAAGGEGAPLTPLFHAAAFRAAARARIVLNLGGIANLAYLPPGTGADGVLAFDVGPGNSLLDSLASLVSGGAESCDRDGALARQGQPAPALLARLLQHPFLRRRPPRSTGRETFGAAFLETLLAWPEARGVSAPDLAATLTAFTARATGEAIGAFLPPGTADLLLCGGGVRNPVLVKALAEACPGLRCLLTDEAGFPARAVEAAAFALLAYLTATGRPGNVPAATGAGAPVILGSITPGRAFPRLPLPEA